MKLFILFLCLISQFKTCNSQEQNKPNPLGVRPIQYIMLKFSEPMAAVDALNKNNFLVTNQYGDTIEIKEIRYLHGFKKPDSVFVRFTHLAIIPDMPLIPGNYLIIFKDLKDFSGNLQNPNPDKTKVQIK